VKILALVPARGGSKRLPGKNARLLGERPLITWSIEAARDTPGIVDVLVSTDSPGIAELAIAAGAIVPWLRPAELATDSATSVDVALHALDYYEIEHGPVDGLLLLQPTSPFRSRRNILRGIALFGAKRGCSVVGVSPAASHPLWCFRIDGDSMGPYVDGGGVHLSSQDLPPAYVVNGAFYLVSPDTLRTSRSFFNERMVPLVMEEPGESIDIDTELDWLQAEIALPSIGQKK
jgi:CMP-N,N'-diacetyllegionaminic acid synthase